MIDVPILFIDIDGTIRYGYEELGRAVNGPADVVIFPDVVARLAKWKADGGRIVGVSNQMKVGLGKIDFETMLAGMEETDRQCGGVFDLMLVCPHGPQSRCWCQKPRYGLVVEGAVRLAIAHPGERYPQDKMLMVGDDHTDMWCANDAGLAYQMAVQWRAGN